jgi:FG-GAP-like repeat/Regulator of chromosome condensation (RCC1) repeat/Immunoglobulin domain/Immunoglobulin I-set domain
VTLAVLVILLPASVLAFPGPGITTQPQSQMDLAGSNAVFTVVANGQATLTYQWSLNQTNLANSTHISGTTSSTLTINNITAGDDGNYQVRVSNNHGSVLSSNATLTVLFPPSITAQPTNESVVLSNNVAFVTSDAGTLPLSPQWYFNGAPLTDGGRISGSATTNLEISDAQPGDAGSYQLVVTNNYGSATSAVVTLTVFLPPGISTIANLRTFPNIATRPVSFSLTNADTALFAVAPANTNLVPPGNIVIAGSGATRTLTVTPGTNATGTTTIFVTVTNEYGLTAGTTFTFTVATFSQQVTNLPAIADGVVSWVDFENDGRLDLLASGYDNNYDPETHFYHNNGDGTFTEIPLVITNVSWSLTNALITSADWADFDGDGYADLLAEVNGGTYVFKNNGGTNLTLVASLSTPWSPATVLWADVDNDGRPDIVEMMVSTWIYHNNGDGTFSYVSSLPGDDQGAVADYNGDGRIDIMEPDAGLFRNVGTNGFVNSGLTFTQFNGGFATWADVNNDGRPDLLLTGSSEASPSGALTVLYRNDGGTFTVIATNLPSLRNSSSGCAAWGDADNDGYSDLFITGFGANGYQGNIFRNNGNETFTDLGVTLPGFNNASAAWADYDNDGALDLIVMGYVNGGAPAIELYHNDGAMPDTPPAAPTGLNVTLGFNSVLFSWNAATDAEQSGGLTYNVRIGTVTNGINVVSPMSDLTTGYRRVPKVGNAGYLTSFFITNLVNGTYYWSVQAIDNTYEGSLFAGEQSFTLPSPVITNQPQDVTVPDGSPALFTVGATGASLSYQWTDNGTNLPGATNSSLSIAPAEFTDEGLYAVIVSNPYGSMVSSNALLTVLTPPSLTSQPVSVTNVVGNWAFFSTSATGSPPISYQWFFNGVPLTDGQITGSASNILTVASMLTSNAGQYWCVVSNDYGSVTSAVVSLIVTAPDILINVDFGSGTQSLKTGPAAIGQTDADFWNFYDVGVNTLTNLLMANGTPTMISVSVAGAGATAPSNGSPDPMFNQFLYEGGIPGNLTVTTSNLPPGTYNFYYYVGCGDMEYQLLVNGVSQGGLQYVSASDNGSTNWEEGVQYTVFQGVVLTNSENTVQTVIKAFAEACLGAPVATLGGMQISETLNGPVAPIFFSQPASEIIFAGSTASFTETVFTNNAPTSYQWTFDGSPLAGGGRITGSAATNLVISDAQISDSGNYQLNATNDYGSAASAVATLTVYPLTSTVIQPQNLSAPGGTNVTFTAVPSGQGPFSYQWMFDGTNIAGATNISITLSNVVDSQSGAYSTTVSNVAGAVVSSNAILTVVPWIVPSISPASIIAGQGTVVFTLSEAGFATNATYQWYQNGASLGGFWLWPSPGAGTDILGPSMTNAGSYYVVGNDSYATATSSIATLTVIPLSVTTQPTNRYTWPGGSARFNVSALGVTPISYQWQFNGMNISGANTNSLIVTNVQSSQLGAYDVVLSNAYTNITSSIANLGASEVAVWGGTFGESNLTAGLTNVVAIAGGGSSGFDCLALRSDTTVIHWPAPNTLVISNILAVAGERGQEPYYLLLTNETVETLLVDDIIRPVTGYTNIVALAANLIGSNPLALTTNGTVVIPNAPAGLGVTIFITNAVAISEGDGFYMALTAGGTVTAWAINNDYSVETNVPPGLSNVIAIAAGYSHSLALKSDGTVVAWGQNTYGQTNVPPGLSNVVAISAGYGHSLALKADGTVAAWGWNAYGQTNVPAGLSNVIAIAAGEYDSLALIGNGPPVMSVPLSNPAVGTNGFTLSLPSQSGRVYVLQYENSLSATNWNSLPLVPGDGGILILTDPTATNQQRFYQVQKW